MPLEKHISTLFFTEFYEDIFSRRSSRTPVVVVIPPHRRCHCKSAKWLAAYRLYNSQKADIFGETDEHEFVVSSIH